MHTNLEIISDFLKGTALKILNKFLDEKYMYVV